MKVMSYITHFSPGDEVKVSLVSNHPQSVEIVGLLFGYSDVGIILDIRESTVTKAKRMFIPYTAIRYVIKEKP